jgi:hypothetical protein
LGKLTKSKGTGKFFDRKQMKLWYNFLYWMNLIEEQLEVLMKKAISFLILILLCVAITPGAGTEPGKIVFDDKNLESALSKIIGKPVGKIEKADLERLYLGFNKGWKKVYWQKEPRSF